MKRIAGYLACSALTLFLCGCQATEPENGALIAPSAAPTTYPTASPMPDFSGPIVGSSGTDTADDDPYQISTLTVNVDTAISQAEKNLPMDDATQDKQTYLDCKAQLSTVENKVEQVEDQLELDYRSQKIDEETYRSLDKQLKQFELRLEQAEEDLELRFGMDD